MASKKDIERLLKKGSLSGLEAARLIIGHHVEQDHNRPGSLSQREISYIKSRLTSGAAAEYNRWIDTYRIIDRTLQEARVLVLEIVLALTVANRELERYAIDHLIQLQLRFRPAIVTEKQYEDIKARQRAEKLKQIQTLEEVLRRSALALSSEDLMAAWEETEGAASFVDFLAERNPDLHRQAVGKLLESIEAGRLRPVQFQPADIERLQGIDQKQRAKQNLKPDPLEATEVFILVEELKRRLYKASQKKQSQASTEPLTRALQRLLEGSLSEEEQERLLEYTFCSGEALAEAGLPEWQAWIEEFMPGYADGEADSYAVIQEGGLFFDTDKQGYYRPRLEGLLERISGLQAMEEQWKSRGFSGAEEVHQAVNKSLREQLRYYLGLQSMVEAVSRVLGVDFAEDLRDWYGDIEQGVERYNDLLRSDSLSAPDMPKLRKIRIDNLKPTASSLRYFEERIALGLGAGWLEMVKELEYPDDEEEPAGEEEPEEVASGQEA